MKMKVLFVACAIFFFCTFKGTAQSSQVQIKGIEFRTLFSNFVFDSGKNKWSVINFDQQYVKIYRYKNQLLVQKSFICSSPIHFFNDQQLNEPVSGICYFTIIKAGNSSKALLFDSTDIQHSRVIDGDSILAKERVFANHIDEIWDNATHTLLSSDVKKNGDVEELYSLTHKKDSLQKGTISLLFTKQKQKDPVYSLAPGLESKKDMQLVKAEVVNYERYMESAKTTIGAAIIPYEVSEIDVSDPAVLIKMFDYARTMLK